MEQGRGNGDVEYEKETLFACARCLTKSRVSVGVDDRKESWGWMSVCTVPEDEWSSSSSRSRSGVDRQRTFVVVVFTWRGSMWKGGRKGCEAE